MSLRTYLAAPRPGMRRRETDVKTKGQYVLRTAGAGGWTGAAASVLVGYVGWRHLALTDHMTKVGNRRAFDVHMQAALRHAERQRRPVSLVMLDVDHFKRLNDEFGHQAGDEALSLVGRALRTGVSRGRRRATRPLVARYGGEEFAIILPGVDAAGAVMVADRLRHDLSDAWTRSALTASAGVATFPVHGKTPAELIDRADQALYRSKQTGRNRTTVYKKQP